MAKDDAASTAAAFAFCPPTLPPPSAGRHSAVAVGDIFSGMEMDGEERSHHLLSFEDAVHRFFGSETGCDLRGSREGIASSREAKDQRPAGHLFVFSLGAEAGEDVARATSSIPLFPGANSVAGEVAPGPAAGGGTVPTPVTLSALPPAFRAVIHLEEPFQFRDRGKEDSAPPAATSRSDPPPSARARCYDALLEVVSLPNGASGGGVSAEGVSVVPAAEIARLAAAGGGSGGSGAYRSSLELEAPSAVSPSLLSELSTAASVLRAVWDGVRRRNCRERYVRPFVRYFLDSGVEDLSGSCSDLLGVSTTFTTDTIGAAEYGAGSKAMRLMDPHSYAPSSSLISSASSTDVVLPVLDPEINAEAARIRREQEETLIKTNSSSRRCNIILQGKRAETLLALLTSSDIIRVGDVAILAVPGIIPFVSGPSSFSPPLSMDEAMEAAEGSPMEGNNSSRPSSLPLPTYRVQSTKGQEGRGVVDKESRTRRTYEKANKGGEPEGQSEEGHVTSASTPALDGDVATFCFAPGIETGLGIHPFLQRKEEGGEIDVEDPAQGRMLPERRAAVSEAPLSAARVDEPFPLGAPPNRPYSQGEKLGGEALNPRQLAVVAPDDDGCMKANIIISEDEGSVRKDAIAVAGGVKVLSLHCESPTKEDGDDKNEESEAAAPPRLLSVLDIFEVVSGQTAEDAYLPASPLDPVDLGSEFPCAPSWDHPGPVGGSHPAEPLHDSAKRGMSESESGNESGLLPPSDLLQGVAAAGLPLRTSPIVTLAATASLSASLLEPKPQHSSYLRFSSQQLEVLQVPLPPPPQQTFEAPLVPAPLVSSRDGGFSGSDNRGGVAMQASASESGYFGAVCVPPRVPGSTAAPTVTAQSSLPLSMEDSGCLLTMSAALSDVSHLASMLVGESEATQSNKIQIQNSFLLATERASVASRAPGLYKARPTAEDSGVVTGCLSFITPSSPVYICSHNDAADNAQDKARWLEEAQDGIACATVCKRGMSEPSDKTTTDQFANATASTNGVRTSAEMMPRAISPTASPAFEPDGADVPSAMAHKITTAALIAAHPDHSGLGLVHDAVQIETMEQDPSLVQKRAEDVEVLGADGGAQLLLRAGVHKQKRVESEEIRGREDSRNGEEKALCVATSGGVTPPVVERTPGRAARVSFASGCEGVGGADGTPGRSSGFDAGGFGPGTQVAMEALFDMACLAAVDPKPSDLLSDDSAGYLDPPRGSLARGKAGGAAAGKSRGRTKRPRTSRSSESEGKSKTTHISSGPASPSARQEVSHIKERAPHDSKRRVAAREKKSGGSGIVGASEREEEEEDVRSTKGVPRGGSVTVTRRRRGDGKKALTTPQPPEECEALEDQPWKAEEKPRRRSPLLSAAAEGQGRGANAEGATVNAAAAAAAATPVTGIPVGCTLNTASKYVVDRLEEERLPDEAVTKASRSREEEESRPAAGEAVGRTDTSPAAPLVAIAHVDSWGRKGVRSSGKVSREASKPAEDGTAKGPRHVRRSSPRLPLYLEQNTEEVGGTADEGAMASSIHSGVIGALASSLKIALGDEGHGGVGSDILGTTGDGLATEGANSEGCAVVAVTASASLPAPRQRGARGSFGGKVLGGVTNFQERKKMGPEEADEQGSRAAAPEGDQKAQKIRVPVTASPVRCRTPHGSAVHDHVVVQFTSGCGDGTDRQALEAAVRRMGGEVSPAQVPGSILDLEPDLCSALRDISFSTSSSASSATAARLKPGQVGRSRTLLGSDIAGSGSKNPRANFISSMSPDAPLPFVLVSLAKVCGFRFHAVQVPSAGVQSKGEEEGRWIPLRSNDSWIRGGDPLGCVAAGQGGRERGRERIPGTSDNALRRRRAVVAGSQRSTTTLMTVTGEDARNGGGERETPGDESEPGFNYGFTGFNGPDVSEGPVAFGNGLDFTLLVVPKGALVNPSLKMLVTLAAGRDAAAMDWLEAAADSKRRDDSPGSSVFCPLECSWTRPTCRGARVKLQPQQSRILAGCPLPATLLNSGSVGSPADMDPGVIARSLLPRREESKQPKGERLSSAIADTVTSVPKAVRGRDSELSKRPIGAKCYGASNVDGGGGGDGGGGARRTSASGGPLLDDVLAVARRKGPFLKGVPVAICPDLAMADPRKVLEVALVCRAAGAEPILVLGRFFSFSARTEESVLGSSRAGQRCNSSQPPAITNTATNPRRSKSNRNPKQRRATAGSRSETGDSARDSSRSPLVDVGTGKGVERVSTRTSSPACLRHTPPPLSSLSLDDVVDPRRSCQMLKRGRSEVRDETLVLSPTTNKKFRRRHGAGSGGDGEGEAEGLKSTLDDKTPKDALDGTHLLKGPEHVSTVISARPSSHPLAHLNEAEQAPGPVKNELPQVNRPHSNQSGHPHPRFQLSVKVNVAPSSAATDDQSILPLPVLCSYPYPCLAQSQPESLAPNPPIDNVAGSGSANAPNEGSRRSDAVRRSLYRDRGCDDTGVTDGRSFEIRDDGGRRRRSGSGASSTPLTKASNKDSGCNSRNSLQGPAAAPSKKADTDMVRSPPQVSQDVCLQALLACTRRWASWRRRQGGAGSDDSALREGQGATDRTDADHSSDVVRNSDSGGHGESKVDDVVRRPLVLGTARDRAWAVSHLPAGTAVYEREVAVPLGVLAQSLPAGFDLDLNSEGGVGSLRGLLLKPLFVVPGPSPIIQ